MLAVVEGEGAQHIAPPWGHEPNAALRRRRILIDGNSDARDAHQGCHCQCAPGECLRHGLPDEVGTRRERGERGLLRWSSMSAAH